MMDILDIGDPKEIFLRNKSLVRRQKTLQTTRTDYILTIQKGGNQND